MARVRCGPKARLAWRAGQGNGDRGQRGRPRREEGAGEEQRGGTLFHCEEAGHRVGGPSGIPESAARSARAAARVSS